MKVRRPVLDFSETPAHWAKIPEFAQSYNASSLWIPHLERFLNKVMARAASEMKGTDPETIRIKDDIRTFIRQEANHYSLHASFNEILPRNGYDVAAFERHFIAEFERLFTTKSLAFLCAYCEGFETLGPPGALTWLGGMEDLIEGARPEVVSLWKWHLVEEFEHRTVCHDVFHALFGGYFMRIYGFLYQFFHLKGFSKQVRQYLLECDRAKMTEAERAESLAREKAHSKRFARMMLPRLFKVFSPFYTPRNAEEPRLYRSQMAKIESQLS